MKIRPGTSRSICWFFYLLFILGIGLNDCLARENERSHVERFASPDRKLERAEREAAARSRANPKDVNALLDLGLAHLNLSKVDIAAADFERAVKIAPLSADAKSDLAYVRWMQGRLDEALVAARAALTLDPDNARAHRYAGRVLLLKGGDRSEAIRHLLRAVQLDPLQTDTHFDLLMAYRAAGEPANTWAQLRLLRVAFVADDPHLLYAEGLLASDQGRASTAVISFRRALAGHPNFKEAREGLGIALAETQSWAEAAEVLESAVKDNPQSFRLAYAAALALVNTQRLAEGEKEVREALKLNPASVEARGLLDQLLARSASPEGKKP